MSFQTKNLQLATYIQFKTGDSPEFEMIESTNNIMMTFSKSDDQIYESLSSSFYSDKERYIDILNIHRLLKSKIIHYKKSI